ncbi:amino acid adenylation domain-containing protein [Kitasatospora sp. GAS204B]|uniref:non-ribosomal peptide synthetase n=1 Tax=unclassified Kitasatospora TaxID=2633591 RepID=UPI002473785F|nr:amino acid adenylation domain-containing protein [Kitasatospora sp. GAS204B]MDH6122398.1 amino acid adenylation domain-containing protein [Kitasatospora sp. GAS204B]
MINPPGSAREFWRDMLAAAHPTTIAHWISKPAQAVAEHEDVIAADLEAALHRLADACAVSFDAVLLAAHAKVLAALSGEPEVVTGYVLTPGAAALPCRLTTRPSSWRALLLEAHRTASGLRTYRDFPLDAMLRDLGLTQPVLTSLFSATGHGGELAQNTVLSVAFTRRGEHLALRLRYRTQALDADFAARIAGYHQVALALMVAGVDAVHGQLSLLSAEERRFQLEQLAGPVRELPNRRFHELFEEQVRARPDAVAVVRGERQWTYQELNQRANALARALLARGLGAEDVVAVVTERTLHWAAAVLAVFKAGGVYLPIEPHFPGERITAMLARAQCELVVTEPASTTTLDQALKSLPQVRTLFIDAALEEGHAGNDLGVEVAADRLAYVFFTSGSTGEPKGAMCEHAGMLNHLYAKVGDLGVSQGQVVAQTAPQCFDISLWQLLAALLVGGRTLLIEQEVILDVDRFMDKIAQGRVAVLQVVPSYLEAVLSHLERHPRELPHLRCVSVTGETLKKELVQRWFAAKPGIRLVNAYGLTETSDDTNHEVMDHAPDGDRVPLGPCVPNARVYIVDDNLSPVPLGAPGEIVFSGVCVGRGYVNDPERTRQSFTTDPHRAGERLYRSGDIGRWLPGAKLEFLGRKDDQVKIRGFRIEIGDIENALLRVPGIRDCAVVIAERIDHSKHLAAFYHAPQPLESDILRERLGATLPAYMVPTTFNWRERLPLTANSKIDRRALTALAAQLDTPDGTCQAPRTSAEKRLAAAWAKVLGVPENRISRQDHFFDLGGTSLSAVKLAIALDRAVSLKDITHRPILADLAELVDKNPDAHAGRQPGHGFDQG